MISNFSFGSLHPQSAGNVSLVKRSVAAMVLCLAIAMLGLTGIGASAQDAKVSLKDITTDMRPPSAKRDPKNPGKKNPDADSFDKFKAEVEKALESLPDSLKRCLIKCKVKIIVSDFVSNGAPDLKGKTPLGEAEGTTYKNIQGVFLTDGSNRLILAQKYLGKKDRITHPTDNPTVAKHEVGHAIDHCAKDFSNSKEFTDAFNADAGNFKPKAGDKDLAENWNGEHGRAEAFADMFAASRDSGNAKRDELVKRAFPTAYELVKRKFKECPDETPVEEIAPGGGKKDGPKKTLKDCHHKARGKLKIKLIGDGTSTSHVELQLTDPVSGVTTSAPIHTVCISPKTKKPPAPADVVKSQNLEYTLAPSAPPELVAIVKASRRLFANHQYDSVAIAPAKRQSTIEQLAIWKKLQNTGTEGDLINEANVTKDILSKAKVDPKSLTTAEKDEVKRRVDSILDAVDLTMKEGEPGRPDKPDEPGQPQKPDEPQTPGRPEQPEKPGQPKQPKKPQTPGQPGKPDEPVTPGRPDEPGNPGKPEDPGTPGQPNEPGIPHGGTIIPEYTVFVPEDSQYQSMMTVTDEYIDCPEEVGQTDEAPGAGTTREKTGDEPKVNTPDEKAEDKPEEPKKPKDKLSTGPNGEKIIETFYPGGKPESTEKTFKDGSKTTETFYPSGSLKTLEKTSAPTKGGDPNNATSETHQTETKEYSDGKRKITKITSTTTVTITDETLSEKIAVKIKTVVREYTNLPESPYVSKETTVDQQLVDTDGPNGHSKKTTTTKTFSGPSDKKGTTTVDKQVTDDKGNWVPAPGE